jgi:hypothetical protein
MSHSRSRFKALLLGALRNTMMRASVQRITEEEIIYMGETLAEDRKND